MGQQYSHLSSEERIFPPTAPHPVRIEFFGDEIDTIKEFLSSDDRCEYC